MFEIITEALFPLILYIVFSVICIVGVKNALGNARKIKHGKCKKVIATINDYSERLHAGKYCEVLHILTVSYVEGNRLYVGKTFTNSHSAKRYKNMQQTEIYLIEGEEMPLLKEHIKHIYLDIVLGIIGGIICVLFTLLILTAIVFHIYENITGNRLIVFI